MGITIAYKGRLNNPDLVYSFCKELSDIADKMNWEYQILDEDFDKQNTAYLDRESPQLCIKGHLALKGISIKIHPELGSLSFYFDKYGNIKNIVQMIMNETDVNGENTFEFIKTDYAPVEVHIIVVKLLRYIKETYVSDLYVEDESTYWETGDVTILYEKMEFFKKKIDEVGDPVDKIQRIRVGRLY